MEEGPVDIEKLKQIFAHAIGEKTIEVSDEEFESLLAEAEKKKLIISENDKDFTIKLGVMTLKIICDFDEDEAELDDEDEEL